MKEAFKLLFFGSIGGGIASVVSSRISFLQPFKWYFVLALASASCWTAIVITRRLRRFRPEFPVIDSDYWIIEKKLSYEYISLDRLIYRRIVRLRALKNGLNVYRDKYRWTGSGKVDVRSNKPEHDFVVTGEKSLWRLYEVRFDKTLNRGEEVETDVIWTLEDPEHKAVPFFSATIEEPTDLLILSLTLPESLGVHDVICEHSNSIGAKTPFNETRETLSSHGEFAWKLTKPKLLHHYEVRWKFPRVGDQ